MRKPGEKETGIALVLQEQSEAILGQFVQHPSWGCRKMNWYLKCHGSAWAGAG